MNKKKIDINKVLNRIIKTRKNVYKKKNNTNALINSHKYNKKVQSIQNKSIQNKSIQNKSIQNKRIQNSKTRKKHYKKGGFKSFHKNNTFKNKNSNNSTNNSQNDDDDDYIQNSNIITELYKINDKLIILLSNMFPSTSNTTDPLSFIERNIQNIKKRVFGIVNSLKNTALYPLRFVKNAVMLKVNKVLKDQIDIDLTKKGELNEKLTQLDNNLQNSPSLRRKLQNVILQIGDPLERLLEKVKTKVLELEKQVVVNTAVSGKDATINVINGIPLAGTLVSIALIIDNILSILVRMTSAAKKGFSGKKSAAKEVNKEVAHIGNTVGVALGNVVEGIPGFGEIVSLIKVIGNILDIANTITDAVKQVTFTTKDNITDVLNSTKPLKDIAKNVFQKPVY